MITRGFYISMFVAVCILFSGGFLFQGSKVGSAGVMIASFSIGIALLHMLDDRERRRKQNGD